MLSHEEDNLSDSNTSPIYESKSDELLDFWNQN